MPKSEKPEGTLPAMQVVRIDSIDDPRLEPYRNQRDQWLRARHNPERVAASDAPDTPDPLAGSFMAEGGLVVEQLLRSPFPVRSVLASSVSLERHRTLLEDGLAEDVPVYVVEPERMDAIAGFNIHRGLLALGARTQPHDPAELARACRIAVVMEDLTNHDNVGGIFRSVAALGGPGAGVLLTERTCDPLYRKALRVSMGHALRVPFAEVPPLFFDGGGIDLLEAAGMTPVALTPSDRAVDIGDLGPIERPALLVGSEGPGLHRRTLERCGLHVRIPIDAGVDSLNVSVAASIALDRLRG